MAKSKTVRQIERGTPTPKRTSIGKSIFSRPKNKHIKKGWKKYRGQGK